MYTNRNYLPKKTEATVIDIPDAPADTISDISFNPENTYMAVAAWDSTVSIYRVQSGFTSSFGAPQAFAREKSFTLPAPCLSVAFFGPSLLAGLVDGTLVCIDVAGGSQSSLPAHSAGIKGVKNYNNQYVVTGSFDGTLKFWDLKSAAPLHTIPLPAKVYSMCLSKAMLCVALSNKTVQVYDMNNINAAATFNTRLSYAIRAVGCGTDMDSFAAGGIEAKLEIFSKSSEAKKQMIRAHREGNRLYSVNMVRFYPADMNIIVSGGADGSVVWFDKVNRVKLASLSYTSPVTAGEFSADGKYFVFSTGDDWSKGYTGISVKPALRMLEVKTISGLNK